MKIKRGSTSVRRLIFIGDSTSTTGAGLTGLVYNSSGLAAYYFAGDLSNEVQITLASATLGSFTSGGFVEVDATNMPGWYEVGIPNAALDGGNEVAIQYRGATNMVPVNIYIELDAVDYQTTAFGANTVTPLDASGIRLAVGLTAANLDTQLAAIVEDTQDIQTRLGSNSQLPAVVRSSTDDQPLNFTWPVTGATISATVSKDNGSFAPTAGTVTFLRTEATGKNVYTLSYDAADRPTSEGQARYVLNDGTNIRSFTLRIDDTSQQIQSIISGIGSVTVPLTIRLANGLTVADCDVTVTTSAASSTSNAIANDRTDANGVVTFQLDPGTYYVWRQKFGINFVNPITILVSPDGSVTVP